DLQRDQRRPHLDPTREVGRAVDRVDDPDAARRVVRPALLLAQDAVVGERGLDLFAEHALDRRIGLRDERQVGLAPNLETVAAEQPHRDVGRAIGESQRERALVLVHGDERNRGRPPRDGISGSLDAAMDTTVERTAEHTVKLTIEVPSDQLAKDLDKTYRAIAREVKIPGFRPGKAPKPIIDAQVGADV